MKILFIKTASGVVTASLVMSLLAPAVLATPDLEISGNGAQSTNKIEVENENVVIVNQGNVSNVLTVAFSYASTGDNQASGNTNGDVTIDTGDATAKTVVKVGGASNSATLPDPCECQSDPTVLISGNGFHSYNKVEHEDENVAIVEQGNLQGVGTFAGAVAKTGKNKAKWNTGPGTVEVKTGEAKSKTRVKVDGPTNTLTPPTP